MTVRAYRAAMLAGGAFAILLFVGTGMLFGSTPDIDKSDAPDAVAQKYLTWLNDGGHRTSVIIGAFLIVLAAIALIWFASALASRLATAGSPMFGFALLAAIGAAASVAGPLAVAGGHTFGSEPLTNDGHVVWLLLSTAFPLVLVVFGLACSAFIASVVIAGRGALPMWLVVSGWIAVVAGLLGVEFLPLGLVLLWFLAAGVYGAVRPAGDAAAVA